MIKTNKEHTMKKKQGVFFFAILLIAVIFGLSGCITTQQSIKSTPDEVGNAAVDEATEAAKDETRKAVREGINGILGR
jgi:cell division septal protein FtsQ